MKIRTETHVLFRMSKDIADYTSLIPLENERAMKDVLPPVFNLNSLLWLCPLA